MLEQWPDVPFFIEEPTSPESEPMTEYKLLTGHRRSDGSFKSSEQLRAEYVELTDNLVHLMTDGIEVDNPNTNERVTRVPDVVIWLDKSARPLSWMTKELWSTLATDSEGNIPPMPEFKFVNIDREQWVNKIDPEGVGSVDLERLDDSIIRSLRSVFVSPVHKNGNLTEDIDTAPSYLDGKTVMIVDEVRSTGRTLEYAKKFFKKAFPGIAIGGSYWMSNMSVRGNATGNADLPVWYKDKDPSGRGIGNRDEQISKLSKSTTQRLGAWFLSTQLHSGDKASQQLRDEIKQLGRDVRSGKVLIVPSLERDEADYTERATRLNDIEMNEFISKKSILKTRT